MNRVIIVLSGKQFSGKDTVAKIILEALPNFRRIGLGDAIKIEYGEIKNLTFEEIEKNKAEYRPDLIELGNKRRSEDADYWLKKVLAQKENLIVPDIRLKHELEIFREQGAIAVRVECDRDRRAERGVLVKENDLTETDLDDVKDWDYLIENNSDLKYLENTAEKVIQDIKKLI
jgi:phosphomevalonate kinase